MRSPAKHAEADKGKAKDGGRRERRIAKGFDETGGAPGQLGLAELL
jgi:hypothetical protein